LTGVSTTSTTDPSGAKAYDEAAADLAVPQIALRVRSGGIRQTATSFFTELGARVHGVPLAYFVYWLQTAYQANELFRGNLLCESAFNINRSPL
jgi:hypothetical protein